MYSFSDSVLDIVFRVDRLYWLNPREVLHNSYFLSPFESVVNVFYGLTLKFIIKNSVLTICQGLIFIGKTLFTTLASFLFFLVFVNIN